MTSTIKSYMLGYIINRYIRDFVTNVEIPFGGDTLDYSLIEGYDEVGRQGTVCP